MSSLSLTFEANALLDGIDDRGCDGFSLPRLEEIRSQMLLAGFNAPFSAVLASTKSEAEDYSPLEHEDSRKQVGNMRYIASLKKFTLNRVRAALSAQKIAKTFDKIGMGAYSNLLPIGGSYRKMLLARGAPAAEAYHKLLSSFATHAFEVQGASAIVEADDGTGGVVERKIELSGAEGADEKVKNIFGPDAKIAKLEKKVKKAGLIRNYSTKVALFTAAALYGAQMAKEEMAKKVAGEKVGKYNMFLARHGLTEDADLTDAEGLGKIKEHALKEGMLQMVKGEMEIDEELAIELGRRRRQRRKIAEKEACSFVLKAVLRCLVSMNEVGRKNDGVPSMIAAPDERQLAVLAHIAPADYPVAHLPKVVAEKIAHEAMAPPFSADAWGPAFVCARAGVDAPWAASELGGGEKAIASAVPAMKSLLEHPQGRAAKFLAGEKKAKAEGKP